MDRNIEELAVPERVFMLGNKPFRIDVLTKISGATFDEAYAARVRVKSEAGVLNVIGRDHFVTNKRASGRPKDLLGPRAVGRINQPTKRRVRSKKTVRRK